jgi:hypothetical protein
MTAATPTRYAAIYARVSTEDQGKGFSISTQPEGCQKLAEHEGYTVRESHVLIDEGISGTTPDRPGLRRLRDLVQSQAVAAALRRCPAALWPVRPWDDGHLWEDRAPVLPVQLASHHHGSGVAVCRQYPRRCH